MPGIFRFYAVHSLQSHPTIHKLTRCSSYQCSFSSSPPSSLLHPPNSNSSNKCSTKAASSNNIINPKTSPVTLDGTKRPTNPVRQIASSSFSLMSPPPPLPQSRPTDAFLRIAIADNNSFDTQHTATNTSAPAPSPAYIFHTIAHALSRLWKTRSSWGMEA